MIAVNRVITILFCLLLTAAPAVAMAAHVAVKGARVSTDAGQTRLVLDTSGSVSHKIFALDRPHRLVVDIEDAKLSGKLPQASGDDDVQGDVVAQVEAGGQAEHGQGAVEAIDHEVAAGDAVGARDVEQETELL